MVDRLTAAVGVCKFPHNNINGIERECHKAAEFENNLPNAEGRLSTCACLAVDVTVRASRFASELKTLFKSGNELLNT